MREQSTAKRPAKTQDDTECRECETVFKTLAELDRHELISGHDPYGVGC